MGRFTRALSRSVSGRRVVNAAAALAVITGVLPTGAVAAAATPAPAPVATVTRASGPSMPRSVPVRVRIPAIKVDARLTKVRADAHGVLQTPPLSRPEVAGWYADGVSPGEIGPAILVGHVDSDSRAAVFYRLRSLRHHDRIFVDREDGSTAVFRVEWTMQVPKKQFPDRKVYGPVNYAALRLITCGGVFDDSTHHYKDNIVVFARLWQARRTHPHRPPARHHGHRHY